MRAWLTDADSGDLDSASNADRRPPSLRDSWSMRPGESQAGPDGAAQAGPEQAHQERAEHLEQADPEQSELADPERAGRDRGAGLDEALHTGNMSRDSGRSG